MSHLTRGAWIEIYCFAADCAAVRCRTSHEVRGLKWRVYIFIDSVLESHLTRGAWIEIPFRSVTLYGTVCRTSHEVRGLKW